MMDDEDLNILLSYLKERYSEEIENEKVKNQLKGCKPTSPFAGFECSIANLESRIHDISDTLRFGDNSNMYTEYNIMKNNSEYSSMAVNKSYYECSSPLATSISDEVGNLRQNIGQLKEELKEIKSMFKEEQDEERNKQCNKGSGNPK